MKIRFIEPVTVKFTTNICCFTGISKQFEKQMQVGDTLDVASVAKGPFKKPKIKTRPGQSPWRYVHFMYLHNERLGTVHPDHVENVPDGSFEILEGTEG